MHQCSWASLLHAAEPKATRILTYLHRNPPPTADCPRPVDTGFIARPGYRALIVWASLGFPSVLHLDRLLANARQHFLSTSSAPKTDDLLVQSGHHLRLFAKEPAHRTGNRKILSLAKREASITAYCCNESSPSPLSLSLSFFYNTAGCIPIPVFVEIPRFEGRTAEDFTKFLRTIRAGCCYHDCIY